MEEISSNNLAEVEQILPVQFVERLKKQLDSNAFEQTLASFANSKPVAIRPNTLLTTERELLQEVHDAGMQTEPVDWCPQCHILTNGTIRGLQELPSWNDGKLYIQAASSMLAVHVLSVRPGMRVLDMCAAPGSKTSQIAALMNNEGMLVANDRSRKRLYRLREILKNQGASNVEVLCGPGERLGQSHADCFDRVLVDAPCSGEGRFRLDKPMRISRWNMHEVKTLAKLQEQLLIAALRCVVVGGTVVYSTCTFAPEENESVLDKVLSRNSIHAEVTPIQTVLRPPSISSPLSEWEGTSFVEDVRQALRIIPDTTTTGFFIAKIKRLV